MNDDTRFILRRMEALEGRVMRKIEELLAFKNKALGIVIVVSFLGGSAGAKLFSSKPYTQSNADKKIE